MQLGQDSIICFLSSQNNAASMLDIRFFGTIYFSVLIHN